MSERNKDQSQKKPGDDRRNNSDVGSFNEKQDKGNTVSFERPIAPPKDDKT